MPPIPGLAEARPWGNREATTAHEVPESLVILGGGVVGVELAQAWSSLGTEVVLLEGAPRVIVREEPFASDEVGAALAEAASPCGRHQADRGSRDGGDASSRSRTGRARAPTRSSSPSAACRRPTTSASRRSASSRASRSRSARTCARRARLALRDRRRQRARAAHPHGQVPGPARRGRILGENVALLTDGPLSPRVIFTEPQVAAVGHTLGWAQEAGIVVRAVDVPRAATPAAASSAGARPARPGS